MIKVRDNIKKRVKMKKTTTQSEAFFKEMEECLNANKEQRSSVMIEVAERLSKQGNPIAKQILGSCYEKRDNQEEKDAEKAKELYKESFVELKALAEEGHPEVQNLLGLCYYEGRGTRKNYKKAVEWFQKSVEQGNSNALLALGICYEHGHGVQRNKVTALELITNAANKGLSRAQSYLGSCYAWGSLVKKDPDQAAEWFYKAKDSFSLAFHGLVLQIMHDYERAVSYFTKAVELGNKDAVTYLINYYSDKGNNPELAEYWRKKAEEQD